MDCDVAGYGEDRFVEIRDEMQHMLQKVGWKKAFIHESCPVIPISGWQGDNVIKEEGANGKKNMSWWEGVKVLNASSRGEKILCKTLLDCLEKFVVPPERTDDGAMRVPLSGVYKIKGIGHVLTGRVLQGAVKLGDECKFLPTHSSSTDCTGKICTVEAHHKNVSVAHQGDIVSMNVKGLSMDNVPRCGDVMVLKTDSSIDRTAEFTCSVQVLDHPGVIRLGYCPIAFVLTGRSPVKLTQICWKVGLESGGQKLEYPTEIKAGEMGSVRFALLQPFVVDAFKRCQGLGRIAIMEGNTVVMLGKVNATTAVS
jgi:elongation factor 1-alpha